MTKYEEMVITNESNVIINDKVELPDGFEGFYTNTKGNEVILIDKDVKMTNEKLCILAEELGHYHTSYGNIVDQSRAENRQQEKRARIWAYIRLVSFSKLIEAYKKGIRNRYELAEFLDITEEFLIEAIKYYKEKYGLCHKYNDYIIYFEPLGVLENFERR